MEGEGARPGSAHDDRESLTQLLSASGFADVQCFEDDPVAHGLKSAVRRTLWRVIRSGLRLYLMAETGEMNAIFSRNLMAVAVKQA